MCGILGIVGASIPEPARFERALDTLRRRGPDDQGTWSDAGAMLGHTRLAILDLSAAGHQPMLSADGRYVIVFNGEVYNFQALRAELERDGERFRSTSDTEVILALYAREGPRCVERFRGMFALAIWDTRERELFLVRDRLGIKPLYIWQFPSGLAFASEVKALSALPSGPKAQNVEATAQFLAWGSVPSPRSMVDGVFSLPPAGWARLKNGVLEQGRYWWFPSGPARYATRAGAIEALRPALRDAVALRCIADVPVGAFLSGGIDSSAVVALMRAVGQSDLRTFSMTFPDTELDEAPFALEVARKFETDHTAVAVSEQMVADTLDDFFRVLDQPTCDGVNTYLVSKFAKQSGMTVALSGLGGDELFAGYPSFKRAERVGPWLERVPEGARAGMGKFAPNLGGRLAKLEAFSLRGAPTAQLYAASRGLFAPSQVRALLSPAARERWAADASLLPDAPVAAGSPFHATMQLELRRYMHDQLLKDSDVFGMAHALEIRVPLIDHEVVEIVAQTAADVVLSGQQKALLRDALPEALPEICTNRPKMGFTFPFDRWMRGAWRPLIERSLLDPQAHAGLLEPAAVGQVWDSFLARRTHWSRPWALYVLSRYASMSSSPG